MALLNPSSRRHPKSFALIVAALLVSAAGSQAQTYYWNPGPAGGGEAQKASNWSSQASGSGAGAPSTLDDDFSDTTLAPWSWIDSVPDLSSTKSFTSTAGKLTITAKGEDVWTDFNQYAAVYRSDITGDFDVSVKVESQIEAHVWSKAGIFVQNDFKRAGAGGVFAVEVTPKNGFVSHYDATDAPPAAGTTAPGRLDAPGGGTDVSVYPCWLRATRVGTVFTGYYKKNLNDPWILIGAGYTPLNTAAGTSSQVGLFVTAHNPTVSSTVVFDDFQGGGNLNSATLDLNFGGSGSLADNNAILGSNVSVRSVDFTGFSGAFSFGGWNISLTGNATFSPTMSINPGTGRLTLSGTTGTQNVVPKVNDTLPVVWKTGGSNAVVLTNPLIADSLHLDAGSLDLGSLNAHLSGFSSAGGTLTGMPAADDTLFLYGKSDFSGLATLTPGLGVVAIKSVGNNRTVEFNPGGKSFRNVVLWTVPTGDDAIVRVGPGDLVTAGNLVFRSQNAPAGQDGNINFLSYNPKVTVGGSITQIIDAVRTNWQSIRMGRGIWSVNGDAAFSLNGGSSDSSTLDLTAAAGTQNLSVTQGPLRVVKHAAAGTVRLTTPLSADSLSLTGGTFDFNGQNLTLATDLVVDGPSSLLANLGGRTLTVGGNASFVGRPADSLNLAPSSDWLIKVTGSFTADYARVANSDARGGSTGMATVNCADRGRNFNWSFGGGPPTTLPAITQEPIDDTVIAGETAKFTVAASGSAPLAYQWRRKGDTTVLSSAAELTLPATTLPQDNEIYQCIVKNSTGQDTSREATLRVLPVPVPARITTEPVDAAVIEGTTANFSLQAVGDTTLVYRWRKVGDTTVLSSVASLALANTVLAQDSTLYQCIVSNGAGSDTSRPAQLRVLAKPVPALITREPRDSTVYVTEKVSFSVGAQGDRPLAFQWRRKGDTTVLSSDSVLTIAATALAQDSALYQCIVSNIHGKDTSSEARLRVLPPPAAAHIAREPLDTLVKVGGKATFSVGVLGTAPIAYEWRRKGDTTLLSGDSLLVIAAAAESQSGYSYYCIVSNALGRDTSAEARLTVRTCDKVTVEVAGDTTVKEGQSVAIFGKSVCADRFEWSIVSGPAPRLLDPGVDTLSIVAPRVTGDTTLVYRFTAFLGDSMAYREVSVRITEAIPDPDFTLAAVVAWNGASPLVLKPTVINKALLDLFPAQPLRYEWSLNPIAAESAPGGDSLVLKDPVADGPMDAVLCMDNGGLIVCDTTRVDVKRGSTSIAFRGRAIGHGLLLSGSRLQWTAPGHVRIWSWQGRLLFEARGEAGKTVELPWETWRSLRGLRARLQFLP